MNARKPQFALEMDAVTQQGIDALRLDDLARGAA